MREHCEHPAIEVRWHNQFGYCGTCGKILFREQPMADAQGQWTYDDGYVLINTIGGDCHYAPLDHWQLIEGWFASGILKTIPFTDVFGAKISVRTDRIESIEQRTPHSLAENTRVNEYEHAKHAKPSWQSYND
jgi:hypothetical protein